MILIFFVLFNPLNAFHMFKKIFPRAGHLPSGSEALQLFFRVFHFCRVGNRLLSLFLSPPNNVGVSWLLDHSHSLALSLATYTRRFFKETVISCSSREHFTKISHSVHPLAVSLISKPIACKERDKHVFSNVDTFLEKKFI